MGHRIGSAVTAYLIKQIRENPVNFIVFSIIKWDLGVHVQIKSLKNTYGLFEVDDESDAELLIHDVKGNLMQAYPEIQIQEELL